MLENRLYKRSNFWKLFSRKYKLTKTIEHMMIDSIDIQGNDRILEIGIGNGTVFKSITKKLEKGSLKSIDPSKRKVRQISRANRKNMGNGEVFHGYPEDIPFDDRTFNKSFLYIRFRAAPILGWHSEKFTGCFKLTTGFISVLTQIPVKKRKRIFNC